MRLNGTFDAFFKIAGSEGPASLFRGMLPTLCVWAALPRSRASSSASLNVSASTPIPLIAATDTPALPRRLRRSRSAMSVPSTVIYFTAYDRLRTRLGGDIHTATSNWAPAAAGAIARSA